MFPIFVMAGARVLLPGVRRMYRLAVLGILLSCWITSPPIYPNAQRMTDADSAATVAVELSALEATGDFNTLYDRIHPDARAESPRAAVIGWYQNEFAPRGPGVATVTGVNFVSWTWAVTGQTYLYTAEVSFWQPFADGTVVEDVVRLVQDRDGEWRWFFGRSREFVDEQIARYLPQVPIVTRNQSIFDLVTAEIDGYWATSLSAAGIPYSSPNLADISYGGSSLCGYLDPDRSPAYYCALDQTIYFSLDQFVYFDRVIGDFAWITILAHEWGHHVQALNGSFGGVGSQRELQADCLAGSYALDAETRGFLEAGDLSEAVAIANAGGDVAGFPQDQLGVHGTSNERIAAFMQGYLNGFIGCGFTMSGTGREASPSRLVPIEPDLTSLLPQQGDVPSDLGYSGDQQRSLADVSVNYTNPSETQMLFTQWGWNGNVTRSYDGTGWSSGVTSVYTSIHRFGSGRDAANALDYSLQDQIASTGAWEITVSPLAHTTRALATSSDVTIYAQQGNVLIRLTVYSLNGDPMPDTQAIMQAMLVRIR